MINFSKNRSMIVCVLLYCNMLHTMETLEIKQKIEIIKIEEIKLDREIKLKNEWTLFDFIQAGEIENIEEKIPSYEFDFMELIKSYTFALEQIKTLTPNKKLRSIDAMQEAIKKIQSQRMIALDRLLVFDSLNMHPNENVHNKKSLRKQIDETLIDQGKLFLECAHKIYPYLEPFLIDIENLKLLFFNIGITGHLDSLQNFIASYESYIDWNYCNEDGQTLLEIEKVKQMSKVSDEQILTLKAQADNGKVTITDGCKRLGISQVTFYRRLKAVQAQSDKVTKTLENVRNELPATIDGINSELQTIIGELKQKRSKADDLKDYCMILDRHLSALGALSNNLKTLQISINNTTVNVHPTDSQLEMLIREVVLPSLQNVGVSGDTLIKAGDKMQELYEKKKGVWAVA